MRLATTIKTFLVLFAVVLLNSVNLTGHSMAMPSQAHDMKAMNHSSSDAASCAILCRTAVVGKEENIVKREEKEKDKDPVPYYLQSQNHYFRDGERISKRSYATNVKPPPKIPIYILYGVFRA